MHLYASICILYIMRHHFVSLCTFKYDSGCLFIFIHHYSSSCSSIQYLHLSITRYNLFLVNRHESIYMNKYKVALLFIFHLFNTNYVFWCIFIHVSALKWIILLLFFAPLNLFFFNHRIVFIFSFFKSSCFSSQLSEFVFILMHVYVSLCIIIQHCYLYAYSLLISIYR
jgi:hypothetical protein